MITRWVEGWLGSCPASDTHRHQRTWAVALSLTRRHSVAVGTLAAGVVVTAGDVGVVVVGGASAERLAWRLPFPCFRPYSARILAAWNYDAAALLAAHRQQARRGHLLACVSPLHGAIHSLPTLARLSQAWAPHQGMHPAGCILQQSLGWAWESQLPRTPLLLGTNASCHPRFHIWSRRWSSGWWPRRQMGSLQEGRGTCVGTKVDHTHFCGLQPDSTGPYLVSRPTKRCCTRSCHWQLCTGLSSFAVLPSLWCAPST